MSDGSQDSAERQSKLGVSIGSDALRWLSDADLFMQLDDLASISARWLRVDLDWSVVQADGPTFFDWTSPDRIVEAARDRGIEILLVCNFTPIWARTAPDQRSSPPRHPRNFARFCAAAVSRYRPLGVRHWEIWNEPNLDNFWKPTPDPVAYADLLDAAYGAIKAIDPDAMVISAGLAAVPVTDNEGIVDYMAVEQFLRAMYARGPRFDALGFHPYTWPLMPSDAAPWNGWKLMTGPVRDIMISYGDGHKAVWITEIGAPTNGEFGGDGVTEPEQEIIFSEAITLAKSHEWTGPIFWYSYRDLGDDPDNPEHWFGIVDADGGPKPAYHTFRKMTSDHFRATK